MLSPPKKLRRWVEFRKTALKDLFIFFSVTLGAFLPARMLFYEHVTHHLIPNMGVVTAIAIIMLLLIRRGTLGFVGVSFRRQMQRFMARRTFRQVLIISIIINIYLGVVLYYMERGEFYYEPIRNKVNGVYVYLLIATEPQNWRETILNIQSEGEYPTSEAMIEVANMGGMDQRLAYADEWLNNGDYALAVTMHESNMVYDGWMSHFGTVFFVEEIETVGLWFLYRKWYFRKAENITPWCGFDKNIKKIMYVKDDNLENVRISNKLVAKFALGSIIPTVVLYIVFGLTTVQFAFITLSLFILFFGNYPKIAKIHLKPNQEKTWKRFRLLMIGMVLFMMTYLATRFL